MFTKNVTVRAGLIISALILILIPLVNAYYVQCDIDVYGLTVSDNGVISSQIRNIGTTNETIVYHIYVDGNVVYTGNVTLAAGTSTIVSFGYPFSVGSYDVGISAYPGCGDWDSETIIHVVLDKQSCYNPYGIEGSDRCDSSTKSYYKCIGGLWTVLSQNSGEYCRQCSSCGDGILNCGETKETCPADYGEYENSYNGCEAGFLVNYKCNGSVLEREFQYNDCSKNWVGIEYCDNGCSSGLCLPVNANEDEGKGKCGIDINDVSYESQSRSGVQNKLTVTVENTNTEDEWINLYFYVDGRKMGTKTFSLGGWDMEEESFYYIMDTPGRHTIKIDSTATNGKCADSDTVLFDATVSDRTTQTVSTTPYSIYAFGLQDIDITGLLAGAIMPNETNVKIYPSEIDSNLFDGTPVRIEIKSAIPQKFTIHVSGINLDWVDYRDELFVRNTDSVRLHLVPKQTGRYTMHLSVYAETEEKWFDYYIPIFVVPETTDYLKPITKTKSIDFTTGFMVLGQAFHTIASILIIAFIVTILAVKSYDKRLEKQRNHYFTEKLK